MNLRLYMDNMEESVNSHIHEGETRYILGGLVLCFFPQVISWLYRFLARAPAMQGTEFSWSELLELFET